MNPQYFKVAVDAPLREPLTYAAPDELLNLLTRGSAVDVPLGKRKSPGVVLGPASADEAARLNKVRAIDSLSKDRPQLPEHFLKWLEWLSEYYLHPIGQVTGLAFPPLKKEGRKKAPPLLSSGIEGLSPPILTQEQIRIVQTISECTVPRTHLIFGVTGSGKTEVYLQLLERVLSSGRQALVLVPEISLTPQLIARFTARFGDRIAALHSQLSERDRTNQWWQIQSGEKSILIGARSALFCPLPRLGMIVVDEEHEASFKQDEKLRYHGRDAAIMLGHLSKVPVVLGSATPSLESWQNAKIGKYLFHELKERATKMPLPEVELLDLKGQKREESERNSFWQTRDLMNELTACLGRGEQSALFLNRRGQAHSVICPGCGDRRMCPNCSISLTLHGKSHLVCHYCDYHENRPEICPKCKDSELKDLGLGTEAVEEALHETLPSARIVRADRDEIQNRQELEELISTIERRETDVVVGTQMIAKGLDFPHLTFVGVVLADVALNMPDFRAPERAFQLLSQVAGRAGRHLSHGKVLIQTFNPQHPSIRHAQTHDFQSFAAEELSAREELGYPPFGRLVLLRLLGKDKSVVSRSADRLCSHLQRQSSRSKSWERIEILGPSEAPLFKIRNNFRYQILVKGPKALPLSQMLAPFCSNFADPGVRLQVDVDPLNML